MQQNSPPPPLPDIPPLPAMAYSMYDNRAVQVGRPGLITAIGVISIVVAGLSLIGSLYTAGSLFAFTAMASMAGMMPAPAMLAPPAMATTTPVMVEPAEGDAPSPTLYTSIRGLDLPERNEVIAGIAELRFLSAPRTAQLHTLLAESGQDIFPGVKGPLTTQRVQDELIQGHATGLSADPAVQGPDTIRTAGGRFELYDDRAVFYPNRGEIVRVAAKISGNADLSPAQIDKVIAQAQTNSGNALNPSQIVSLRTILSTPGQQYVSPITIPTAVRSAQVMPDGSVMLTFPSGFASITPQGQVTSSTSNAPGAPAPFLGGRIRINRTALALAGFSTLAGAGLAIYLLVIGIMTLRNSPRGRKLHLVYAILKIPVTILGGVAVWWMTTSFFEAMSTIGGNPMLAGSFLAGLGIQQGVMAVIALIYPVALLITLQTRTVKEYYASAG